MKVVKIIDHRSSTVFIQKHTQRILFLNFIALRNFIMTWTCIEQREQVHKGHGGNRVIRKLIFTEIFLDNFSVDETGLLKPLSDTEIKALTVSLYRWFYHIPVGLNFKPVIRLTSGIQVLNMLLRESI